MAPRVLVLVGTESGAARVGIQKIIESKGLKVEKLCNGNEVVESIPTLKDSCAPSDPARETLRMPGKMHDALY